MSSPTDQSNPSGAIPVYIGTAPSASGSPAPPVPPPVSLAAGANWNSGAIPSLGYKALAVGATLSQAGTIQIQRYLNAAGTIALGNPVPSPAQAMTANTPATIWVNDGQPSASWSVVITNTSGSTATLGNVAILQTP